MVLDECPACKKIYEPVKGSMFCVSCKKKVDRVHPE